MRITMSFILFLLLTVLIACGGEESSEVPFAQINQSEKIYTLEDVKITINAFEEIAQKLQRDFYTDFQLPSVGE